MKKTKKTKKTIWFKTFLCFFTLATLLCSSIVQAAGIPDKQDTIKLISNFKDIRYRLEAGTTYNKYNDYYSDLRVAVMRFKDSNEETVFDKEINDLLGLYDDIDGFWQTGRVHGYGRGFPLLASALNKYPGLDEKLKWVRSYNGIGMTTYVVIDSLFTYIDPYEKKLIDKVNAQYN